MNRIKELRKLKKMNQKELAELLGVHQMSVSRYENGQMEPSLHIVNKMCKILNCTSDYLLGLSDENAVGSSMPASNAEDSMDFERLQKANMLFLELNEAGKAQATAYLEFLVAQQQKREG